MILQDLTNNLLSKYKEKYSLTLSLSKKSNFTNMQRHNVFKFHYSNYYIFDIIS